MNAIIKRDPVSSLFSIPRFFDDFDLEFQRGLKIRENDQNIIIEAVVAGVPSKDVDINIEDGVLTIKAEASKEDQDKDGHSFFQSRYYYTTALSGGDWEKAEAETKHGVVKITIPKMESARPRKIVVKSLEE